VCKHVYENIDIIQNSSPAVKSVWPLSEKDMKSKVTGRLMAKINNSGEFGAKSVEKAPQFT